MKDKITQNPIASTIIVILLVIIGGLLLSKRTTTTEGTKNETTNQATSTSTTGKTTTQTTGTTKTTTSGSISSIPMTYKAGTDYDAYARQLTANQGICNKMAEKQYEAIYRGVLESSGFVYNYTSSSGQCYMRVTGQTRPQYATTTIGHIYFRNVLRSIVLAECTNPKGNSFSENDWVCTNKITGQTIIKAKYDDLVTSYLSK